MLAQLLILTDTVTSKEMIQGKKSPHKTSFIWLMPRVFRPRWIDKLHKEHMSKLEMDRSDYIGAWGSGIDRHGVRE
jgi:hypothetical protein